jgi:VIT1/CCC1 family predicted Fe2+/Mn2+ transporter
MSRLSVPGLARTGLQVLATPWRFRAILDAEEGIARAVLFFFTCAALATAVDLGAILLLRGSRHFWGAVPMELLRLFFLTGLVPFTFGGGIVYGVSWICGSKAIIETGIHIASFAIGVVLPIAAVLRNVPGRGLQAAIAVLGYGLLLVIVGTVLAWRGKPAPRAERASSLAA